MNPNKSEIVTKLFITALYYWHAGDKLNARGALDMAVQITSIPAKKMVA